MVDLSILFWVCLPGIRYTRLVATHLDISMLVGWNSMDSSTSPVADSKCQSDGPMIGGTIDLTLW